MTGNDVPVVDFDPLDPAWGASDPEQPDGLWPRLNAIRNECPVARGERYGGFWLLTRYRDVRAVMRDWETFSSSIAGEAVVPLAPDSSGIRLIPSEVDPPFHTVIRRALSPYFSDPAVGRLRAEVHTIAHELIDVFIDDGACEFRAQFADLFTARVIFERFLGLPPHEIPEIMQAMARLISDPANASSHLLGVVKWCERVIEEQQGHHASGTIFDVIFGELPDGTWLTHRQQVEILYTLGGGGLETVGIALSNIMYRLATDPAVDRQLRDLPDLKNACEEFLRHQAPSPGSGRTLTRDTELAGVEMKAGERVTTYFGAANRDPGVFSSPDVLDLQRPNANRHLSFGAGLHACIGAPLARLLLTEGLGAILERMEDIALDERSAVVWHGGLTVGNSKLPLRFRACT